MIVCLQALPSRLCGDLCEEQCLTIIQHRSCVRADMVMHLNSTSVPIVSNEAQMSANGDAESRHIQPGVFSVTTPQASEQSALSKLSGLESALQQAQAALEGAKAQIASSYQSIEAQGAVNMLLMGKKQEMEWQLMEAMAKVNTATNIENCQIQNASAMKHHCLDVFLNDVYFVWRRCS